MRAKIENGRDSRVRKSNLRPTLEYPNQTWRQTKSKRYKMTTRRLQTLHKWEVPETPAATIRSGHGGLTKAPQPVFTKSRARTLKKKTQSYWAKTSEKDRQKNIKYNQPKTQNAINYWECWHSAPQHIRTSRSGHARARARDRIYSPRQSDFNVPHCALNLYHTLTYELPMKIWWSVREIKVISNRHI